MSPQFVYHKHLVSGCYFLQCKFNYPTDLQVTSLPTVLFQSNGGQHNVVEGSVIQLYCSVETTTAAFSWFKNRNPLVLNVPRLRERTTNDSTTTTSVLTIENFQSRDTGMYHCSAKHGLRIGNGMNVMLYGNLKSLLLLLRESTYLKYCNYSSII